MSQTWAALGNHQNQHHYQGNTRLTHCHCCHHGDGLRLYGMLPGIISSSIISSSNPFLMALAEMAQASPPAAAIGSSSALLSLLAALWMLFWETIMMISIPTLFRLVTIAIVTFVFCLQHGAGGGYNDHN